MTPRSAGSGPWRTGFADPQPEYQGFVDLEYEIHPDDPMPGVIASFAYMRGVLAGMGFASIRGKKFALELGGASNAMQAGSSK
jgi:hypothetical protein